MQAALQVLVTMRAAIRGAMVALMLATLTVPCFAEDVLWISGSTMGTTFSVKLAPLTDSQQEQLQVEIDERLELINQRMSTYLPDSEVSQFNRFQKNEWMSVSLETAEVVRRSLDLSRQTDGAFDITVSPLVRLWNFGAGAESEGTTPNEEQIEQTRAVVGFEKLSVRLDPPALRKSVDGLEIDLSAIAKGFAVDEVAQIVKRYTNSGFMVEIGGEIRVSGSRPDGQSWGIGIEGPWRERRQLAFILEPRQGAIATSGDYRNYYLQDGIAYSHALNPRTGRPIQHPLAGVTVMAEDCATADAWATALLVLGLEKGLVLADQEEIQAVFLTRKDQAVSKVFSRAFDQSVVRDKSDVTANAEPESTFASFWRVALVALAIFAVALLGMSIGVIVSNRRIQGSCGGLAGLKDEHGRTMCEACTKPSPDCGGRPDVGAPAETSGMPSSQAPSN